MEEVALIKATSKRTGKTLQHLAEVLELTTSEISRKLNMETLFSGPQLAKIKAYLNIQSVCLDTQTIVDKGYLESLRELADKVVIVANNCTPSEYALFKKYRVSVYDDNREWGENQWQIKERLHAAVGNLRPDWVLCNDMDEVSVVTRKTKENLYNC